MTKAELINEIAISTGFDKTSISVILESFMRNVKQSLANDENVYLRGFGSFITKHRAAKIARDINKHTSVHVPAHRVPAFKPSAEFAAEVR